MKKETRQQEISRIINASIKRDTKLNEDDFDSMINEIKDTFETDAIQSPFKFEAHAWRYNLNVISIIDEHRGTNFTGYIKNFGWSVGNVDVGIWSL